MLTTREQEHIFNNLIEKGGGVKPTPELFQFVCGLAEANVTDLRNSLSAQLEADLQVKAEVQAKELADTQEMISKVQQGVPLDNIPVVENVPVE